MNAINTEGGGKSTEISLLRFLSMIMIIACHMLQYYDNELCRWFNIGVQVFFVISGFLYGKKEICNPIQFFQKTFIKILVPYYTFIVVAVSLYLLYHPELLSPNCLLKVITCSGTIKGLGHLWFVGYILFCYAITPYLYWLRISIRQYSHNKKLTIYVIVLLSVQILSLAYNSYFIPDRISCYIVGFFLADILTWNDRKISFVQIMIVLLAISLNGVEVLGRYISPDLIAIMGETVFNAISRYGHCILGISLFTVLKVIFKNIRRNSLLDFSDKYSYSIYIVHLLFILSPFSLMRITPVTAINWTLVVVSVLISGILLNKTSELIQKELFN